MGSYRKSIEEKLTYLKAKGEKRKMLSASDARTSTCLLRFGNPQRRRSTENTKRGGAWTFS
jgi:hypothetical protein